jgi:putative selenium metabolism protein SsnA
MDSYLIGNGTVVCLGEAGAVMDDGAVLVRGGRIADVGGTAELKARHGVDVSMDARGKIILPGFICAHHHLYSTMARGFAPPGEPAFTFREILERLWWKLDRALDSEDVRLSALIPLIACIRSGTTTIFDHHASPSCRDGSLDIIADAVLESGLRASLCYEVSDRNVPAAGVSENERFLDRVARERSDRLSGMVGIHASLTVSDETLALCRAVGEKHGAGYHIHVAEGTEDGADAQARFGRRTVERLVSRGICGPKSLFIHCVNVDDREIELVRETGTPVVHNPESNMNNAVGVAPALEMMRRGILVGLGTDGMSSHMPSQMRCAYLVHRLAARDPRVGFMEAPRMLLGNNAAIANRHFPVPLGVIEKGAAADLALLDYVPPTPLSAANFLGHFIFGMVHAPVDTTIVSGKVLMREKRVLVLDEEKIAADARQRAPGMWRRIN